MKRSGSESNIAARAVLLAVAYVLVTAGLLAGLLYQLRSEALAAAKKELGAYAQLTAGHTFEVALGVEEALQLAAMTLSVASGSGAAEETQIRQMLRDVAANARVLKDIVVIDTEGRAVYQANGHDDIGKDRAGQPYFARFKADAKLKFEVAATTRGAAGPDDAWSIPMAHVWRRLDGAFAGVVVGLVDPQYFGKAWTFDSEIKGLAIALTAADGTVITRQPFAVAAIGRPLLDMPAPGSAPGQQALASETATLIASNPIDGVERLFAYRKVAAYPTLLVFVSQPMDVVLAGWRGVATIVGGGWLMASLALGVLGLWLARTIRARGLLESRYRALFDSIPHPVVVSDDNAARVLAFNAAAARQYGWTGEATVDGPRLPTDFELLMARRPRFSSHAATAIEGQRHRNGAGELIDVDMTVRLIDYNGRPAILAIAVDVTARRQAERERQLAEDKLRQSQKMDVLGQLTGGIAHDFNNTLMVVQGNVETLLERRDVDPDAQKLLAQIARSTETAEELTRQMLAFSRKQPLRPRPTSVNDLVVETGKLLRRTLGEQDRGRRRPGRRPVAGRHRPRPAPDVAGQP
jgi:PAS domain S-box-containing protein